MAETRIETERLVLRDWREDDWPRFLAGTNTPAVMRWLGGVLPEERHQWLKDRLEGYTRDHGHTFWVVERKEDGALLGFCGLKRANQPGAPLGDFEVGWRLREDAWRKGYAKEAAQASLEQAFLVHHAPHVIALTVPGNTGSWGLMVRLGMERREDLDFDNTEFDPEGGRIIVYSITREAWEKMRG
jgi:RimJ/RimL family protein N-acetyltransferase